MRDKAPCRREVNGMEVVDGFLRTAGLVGDDEVWVHGMWTPDKWGRCLKAKLAGRVEVRIEDNVFGDAKEQAWAWCDVLVVPTLSENFSLVVAEALERGRPVITTDGAPAWRGFPGVTCLEGFVAASRKEQEEMLYQALSGKNVEGIRPKGADADHARVAPNERIGK